MNRRRFLKFLARAPAAAVAARPLAKLLEPPPLDGLQAWLPANQVPSDPFFGTDRTTGIQRDVDAIMPESEWFLAI